MIRLYHYRMAFLLNDGILRSDTSDAAYRAAPKFRRVLATLPDDTVPRSLILLGLLTEQLTPMDSDAERQIRTASENVDRAPTATISAETVDGVMWLLQRVKESLDPERKRTIGELIAATTLDTPIAADLTAADSRSSDVRETVPSDDSATTAPNQDLLTLVMKRTTPKRARCPPASITTSTN